MNIPPSQIIDENIFDICRSIRTEFTTHKLDAKF